MKKLLSILAILSSSTGFSTSVVSCGSSTTTDIKSTIENKIENGNNSIIRGDDLSTDASDNLTQTTILNTIGLTNDEKTYVTTSGTLIDNENVEIEYNILDDSRSAIYKTVTNNIKLEKMNGSITTKSWYLSNFSTVKNITLYNQKQLVISGADIIEKDSPISDVNLDFSSNYVLANNSDSPSIYEYAFNKNIYSINSANTIFCRIPNTDPDEYGNYTSFSNDNIDTTHTYIGLTSSNNELYAIAKNNDDNESVILNIKDENIITIAQLDKFDEGVNVLNTIWNLNGTLYIGTNAGLYKSTDDGTIYSLVEGTNDLNIKNIISTSDGSKIFLNTDSGLYVSTNEKDFSQILDTASETINSYSLFIDNNDILYYGVLNKGLWSIDLNYSTFTPTQIITNNIQTNSDIKSIVQYSDNNDNTLILLTDKDLVYLTD